MQLIDGLFTHCNFLMLEQFFRRKAGFGHQSNNSIVPSIGEAAMREA